MTLGGSRGALFDSTLGGCRGALKESTADCSEAVANVSARLPIIDTNSSWLSGDCVLKKSTRELEFAMTLKIF
jgi:hypothetical protein